VLQSKLYPNGKRECHGEFRFSNLRWVCGIISYSGQRQETEQHNWMID